MTYCVGLLIDEGLVMAADTRTNAGLDNVGKFKKLHTWAKPGERVFVLLTAGNLAVTQAVTSLLEESMLGPKATKNPDSLFAAKTMFQAARIIGKAIREVRRIDGEHLGARGEAFSASFIFGGQIGKERPRLFQIYTEGNFIEATVDTPFFQIGEHKYGKPILDRVADAKMPLGEAAKMILISFDSTLRSNLSVGLPIDMLTYENGSLKFEHVKRIGQDDPYFRMVSGEWSKALRVAFKNIEPFDI
ncbi:proteasome-type protease [Aestuariivirga litoralis]|uniref:proteasome-type protease n=1 Tax=Aestuariivirga litoralis TaxID=2650924 RepID=UPI0018C4E21E|nr:proteasome-type protease [Aestuariivirga litoralis]MBG1232612.1 proteasome-type protease [Aestuariivirga litoralis]